MRVTSKAFAITSLLAPLFAEHPKVNNVSATEMVGLSIHNLQICHQGNWRDMTFQIHYQADPLGTANNVSEIRDFVHEFLNNYPNTTDFWEVMNKKLTLSLTDQFPDIILLESNLAIGPDREFSFPRESIVHYSRESGITKESFRFTKLNYLVCNETFKSLDFHVSFDFKEKPDPSDYPDYQWIDAAMEQFFAKEPVSFSKWEKTKHKLEAFLKEKFPTLPCLEIDVSAAK